MKIKWLVNLGLLVVPFIIINGYDTRLPKEVATSLLCLALGLSAFYYFGLCKNVWLLLFIFFLGISMWSAPVFGQFKMAYLHNNKVTLLLNRDTSHIWSYKALFFILSAFLAFITVSNAHITVREVDKTLLFMCIAGLLMGIYVLIQYAGLDQFFAVKQGGEFQRSVTRANLVGTLGQPTIVSAFLALIVPLSIYLKRYSWSIVMSLAVVLTESKMALLGLGSGLIFYSFFSGRIGRVLSVLAIIMVVLGGSYFLSTTSASAIKDHANGRLGAWTSIWNDYKTPPIEGNNRKYTMTGFGVGSLPFTYAVRHSNRWHQAHNEYLEILYTTGLIGLGLFLMAIRAMFKDVLRNITPQSIAIASAVVVVLVCALGTFPFQIAATALYTVVLVGFLHNPYVLRG